MKRDDMIHPSISGNKWRKMKYNIQYLQANGFKTLITKGGAFSNHIYATAAAGKIFNIATVGLIRGEIHSNPTLNYAQACGMRLVPIARDIFPHIDATWDLTQWQLSPTTTYFLPEGGTNALALLGTQEIVKEANAQITVPIDYFAVAGGTGGTAAGMIQAAANTNVPVLVFSALKGDFLQQDIELLLQKKYNNWTLQTTYHFGGYAKFDNDLIDFINDFKAKHEILLDPIYTGKMMFGLFDNIKKGTIAPHSHIVAVHTGGLQGIAGFQQRYGNLLSV